MIPLFIYFQRLFFHSIFMKIFKTPKISLTDQHICITGGSEGIGLSVALEAIKQGAGRITLISRNRDKLEQAVSSLYKISNVDGANCFTVQGLSCDVTHTTSVKDLFHAMHSTQPAAHEMLHSMFVKGFEKNQEAQELKSPFSSAIDILVTAAGVCICDAFHRLSCEEIEYQLKLNVAGTLFPCRELFDIAHQELVRSNGSLHGQRQRVVVLLASEAAQVNLYGFVAYGASKFAIRGAWEALSMEGQPLGIRTVCVFPPSTETPGYAIECQRKPWITSQMEGAGGLYTSSVVGERIVSSLRNKNTCRVVFGPAGRLLASLTRGFSPASSVAELFLDVLLYFPGMLTSFYLRFLWTCLIRSVCYSGSK